MPFSPTISTGRTTDAPAATLDQLSHESAAAIGRVLPRLCRAVLSATGATAYNVLQNNGVGAHQAGVADIDLASEIDKQIYGQLLVNQ